ncbi:MAG TPA: tetratricopeptide repeat protein [Chthoniobacteraceae bacterium]|nr:tetratricopeptide repeat protein [Chthoniobacteraceae bacterium]
MNAPATRHSPAKTAIICALLAALVFALFGKTTRYGFVYDDEMYILNNSLVQKGLTWKGIAWSFTLESGEIGHWHPLTWMSHMLDCGLYGLAHPGGHHLTNVFLHAAATVLLFLALRRVTGAFWRCAFVAAGWAIHPLRAESVAWIAERKDVLSGVFFMLALWAYVAWVSERKPWRYVLMAALFAVGLLCKDMLVTLPFLLLVLDYWPLGRLEKSAQFPRLLLEKIPLFALSVAACIITVLVPEQVTDAHHLPLWLRLENALVSYCIYLRQSVWPSGLSPNYPNPAAAFPLWEVAGAIVLLCLITWAVFALRRRHPYLLAGWLWFAGMLVPVIGVVQISHYSHADRYTYLPQIGLWIAGVWLAADAAARLKNREATLATASAAILCGLFACAWQQVSYWRDSISLWTRALECNPNDFIALNNLGSDLRALGLTDEAMRDLREALRLAPNYDKPHYNLGLALEGQGDLAGAANEYRAALKITPDYTLAHLQLGSVLQQQGDIKGAIEEYRAAVKSDPGYGAASTALGNILLETKDVQGALENYQDAVASDPSVAAGHNNLGNALMAANRLDEAVPEYREAVRLKPDYDKARFNLGNALLRQGHGREGIAELEQAVALKPDNAIYQDDLAWVLSASPDPALRDGKKALELAAKASASAGGKNPLYLRTLGAAYAQTGDFAHAAESLRKAIDIVEAGSRGVQATELRRELKLYEEGRAFESGR